MKGLILQLEKTAGTLIMHGSKFTARGKFELTNPYLDVKDKIVL